MIRRTVAADLPAVVAMEAEAARWLGETGLAGHARVLGDPDCEHLVLTGPDDDEPAGFLVLAGAREPSGAELRRVVVAARSRGLGYGRQLMLAGIEPAAELGARQVWLDVKPGNAGARHHPRAVIRRAARDAPARVVSPPQ